MRAGVGRAGGERVSAGVAGPDDALRGAANRSLEYPLLILVQATERRSRRTAERQNSGTAELRNGTSTQMRADTPADAGDADGRRLAFTPSLTGLVENERPREAIAPRGRFIFSLMVRATFKVHLRASASGTRSAPRICAHLRRSCFSAAPPFRCSSNSRPVWKPAAKISATAYFRGGDDGKNSAAWPHAAPVAPCGQR